MCFPYGPRRAEQQRCWEALLNFGRPDTSGMPPSGQGGGVSTETYDRAHSAGRVDSREGTACDSKKFVRRSFRAAKLFLSMGKHRCFRRGALERGGSGALRELGGDELERLVQGQIYCGADGRHGDVATDGPAVPHLAEVERDVAVRLHSAERL
jgi:hypothetical protein